MYTKNANNQGSAPHFLLIGFLVIGIIVFVGAIVSQNFSLFSEAATTEPVCTRSQPSVTVLPENGSGVRGSSIIYSISVTNKDMTGCGPTTFNFGFVMPANWRVVAPKPLLIAPGTSGKTQISVTSPFTATNGKYPISMAITSSAGSAHTVNKQFFYTVTSSVSPTPTPMPVNNPPVISTMLLPNATLNKSYSANITAQDPDRESVSVTITNLPRGLTSSCSELTNSETRFTTCTVTGTPVGAGGSFVVKVTAKDVRGLITTKDLILKVIGGSIITFPSFRLPSF